MQWVLPSCPARRPSAVRDAWRFTHVIWVHQAEEGKVGENPLTYKEALRKEKYETIFRGTELGSGVLLTPKTTEWQAFLSHSLCWAV
jgi:hypothetical protein